jgi:hypothetical protein
MRSDKDLARDVAVPECLVESLRSWEHTIQRAIRSVIFDNLSLIYDLASQYTVCASTDRVCCAYLNRHDRIDVGGFDFFLVDGISIARYLDGAFPDGRAVRHIE